jgi:hypothetical protein
VGSVSFDQRFELGELARFDGIRTFSARDRASGQVLLAHFLENASEAAEILASVNRLPERERQRIVDRGERDGVPFIVTGSLSGYPGFREWLAANAREPRPLDSAGAWKVVLPESNVDEQFLSLFPTGERAQAKPEPSEFAEPAAGQQQPGEFTRLFQAPSQPAPAGEAGSSAPGEFTRMFQAPAQQPSAPPESKKPEGPGEFTRFFEAQGYGPNPNPFAAGAPPAPATPPAPKQGEFTKVFGAGEMRHFSSTPAPPSAAPPSPPEPVPLSSVFPPAKPPSPQVVQGPGEYTRLFSAGPSLTLGQTRPETPVTAPASSGRAVPARSAPHSRWPLILGIAAVAVLVAAVVLFVASRSK